MQTQALAHALLTASENMFRLLFALFHYFFGVVTSAAADESRTQNSANMFEILWCMRIVLLHRWTLGEPRSAIRASDILVDMLSLLRRVVLRYHPSPWKPPYPYLEEVPVEMILHIASFLPTESAVCLSLASKSLHQALNQRIDMRFSNPETDPAAKKRFARLLEIDVPGLISCHGCSVLHRWNRRSTSMRPYLCRNHYRGYPCHHKLFIPFCTTHAPYAFHREVLDAFIRGYERGPAYGPQLHALEHQCKTDSLWGSHEQNLSRSTQARMVLGKLMLRINYELEVPPDTPLVPEVDKFKCVGCSHSSRTLPGVIMDAIDQTENDLSQPRSTGYVNCWYCATDLQVRVISSTKGSLVFKVDTWHFLGGRDHEREHPTVRSTLDHRAPYHHYSYDMVPTRNLEKLYNEGLGDELHHPPPFGPSSRVQSWLQSWQWWYNATKKSLEYRVPSTIPGRGVLKTLEPVPGMSRETPSPSSWWRPPRTRNLSDFPWRELRSTLKE